MCVGGEHCCGWGCCECVGGTVRGWRDCGWWGLLRRDGSHAHPSTCCTFPLKQEQQPSGSSCPLMAETLSGVVPPQANGCTWWWHSPAHFPLAESGQLLLSRRASGTDSRRWDLPAWNQPILMVQRAHGDRTRPGLRAHRFACSARSLTAGSD